MRWLVDLIQALLWRRTPEQGAAVVLPSDAAAEPVASTADASASLLAMVIAAGCSVDRAQAVADAFAAAFARFGIDDRPLVQAHILANCAHESGNFTATRENLNYTSVVSIRQTFGRNAGISRLTDAELIGLVSNPVALANIVYADHWRSPDHKLGNVNADDGWRFRGWGWAQLTGRATMERFAATLGTASAETLAAMTDPAVFAHGAVWFAVVEKRGFVTAAERDDIVATRRAWNGGDIGLAQVRAARQRIHQQTGV